MGGLSLHGDSRRFPVTAPELLAQLVEQEISLSINGEELIVRGEASTLRSASLVALLREHKQALVELIRSGQYTGPDGARVHVPANGIPADCVAITPDMLPLVSLTPAEIACIVAAVSGGAANIQDIYPLAPLQEGIFFHHLLREDGDPYVVRELWSCDSRRQLDAFVAALQAVIDRHDIFRTAVVWDGLREPIQVVWRQARLSVEEVALEPDGGDVATQLRARYDLRHQRLDVREAPLMRVAIAEDAVDGRWLLLWRLHHLIGDQMTLAVLLREVWAHLVGQQHTLPAPLPFRQFVAQARASMSREAHAAFFTRLLADVTEPTTPFGLANVHRNADLGEAREVLDGALAQRLRARARMLGVSAASLCHLAFAQVLGRVSGRADVVFGTVLFGRMQAGDGADRAPGLFINTLPIRVRLDDTGVDAGVRQIHTQLAELLRHEHASLALAQRCSGVVAPAPLFSAVLNYRQHGHPPEARAADAPPDRAGLRRLSGDERSHYPFVLAVNDFGARFVLHARVARPGDPTRVCAYMVTALTRLVEALEQAPATPLRRLDVAPSTERRQMLEAWNERAAPYPRDRCVHELIEAQAMARPDAVAAMAEGQALTYGELNARANRLAHELRRVGVEPDQRVALCVPRGLELVVGVLAVLKAGGAFVPLDPSYPAERLAFMLADSRPIAVLTRRALAAAVQAVLQTAFEGTAAPRLLDLDAEAARCAESSSEPRARGRVALRPDHLAYVIYTSGSTGTPKGAMATHRGVCNLAAAQLRALEIEPTSRVLQFSSLSFDACVWEAVMALCSGAALQLAAPGAILAGDVLADTVDRHGVTHLTVPPSVLSGVPVSARLASVRTLIVAGETSTRALVERWAPGRRLINAYGPTETTVCATWGECDASASEAPPIGRPIGNMRMYVLDAQFEPALVGVVGELYVGGVGVTRGYWQRPALTAARFVADPFGPPGARLYRTGDLGSYRADGAIEFVGREDFQVKLRGFRIELGEIEARLRACPGVCEAVVVAREDQAEDRRLVAYYTRTDTEAGAAIGPERLRRELLDALPEYMAPAAYVALPAMPLTPNGKLDRAALPAPGAEARLTGVPDAPRSEIERRVADIWAELLGIEQVGRHDNFFELGGHSLLAVRVVSRLRQDLGVEVDLSDWFEQPVLSRLAEAIERAARPLGPAIAPVDRATALPLSFSQQRLWFLAQLGDSSQAYHVPTGWRLRGRLHREALRAALDRIVARHESLRTTFALANGEPTQRIAPPRSGFALEERDLRRHAAAPAMLDHLIADEATKPFDLAAGPLIRGRLIRLDDAEHVLLITMHHIVSDGWSMGVFIRELGTLYRAFRHGRPDPLPPLTIQYADYASWERSWLAGERLQTQSAYWQETLAGAPPRLELPTDFPRPAEQTHAGAVVGLTIDAALTGDLKAFSRRHGATLFMTVATAWAVVLARLSGQTDFVIGVPVANRSRAEIEPLIGFFVNTLALRIDLAGHPTAAAALQRVKAQVQSAQQHQDLPFEQVVELVKPVRSLAHSPLFQVALIWQQLEGGRLDLPDLTAVPARGGYAPAKVDMSLNLGEVDGRIIGGLGYATALFARETAVRYGEYLRHVLTAMIADEDQPVDRIAIMGAAERQQVLETWNETSSVCPPDGCVHELVEAQAAERPDAIAVAAHAQALTYGELEAAANRLAHHLRELSVGPDRRVALCGARGPMLIVGQLAVWKAGGAYVPLDPSYPTERLAFMLSDSQPSVVLTCGELAPSVRALLETAVQAGATRLDLETDAGRWSGCSATTPTRRAIGLEPEHLAYVIYTSGSTGAPKAVMATHRSACNLARAQIEAFTVDPGSRVLQFSSLSFDACASEILMALCSGAVLQLPAPGSIQVGELLADTLETCRSTHVTLPPSVLAGVSDDAALRSVRMLIVAGEAPTEALVRRWATGRRVINGYGPTETTVCATLHHCDPALNGAPPIGRPLANTRIYVLDRQLEPSPIGVVGELYIGGVGVARGYWRRAALTATCFVADPHGSPGARLYRTGDLGRYRPDGAVEFVGRDDGQVKVRGFRIELGEIEARLRAHPGVREAVVTPWRLASRDLQLVAYYTVTAGEGAVAIGTEVLRNHIAAALPEYMAPAAYVALPAMPLSPNGKVDRAALPAPDQGGRTTRAYEAPIDALERRVSAIWASLLGVERVGRHDNFFELGGHSLLAVSVIERMRQVGLHADVRVLFATPTLTALAAATRDHTGRVAVPPNAIPPDCVAITPEMLPLVTLSPEELARIVDATPGGAANIQDIYPLAPLQEGMLFHHLLREDGDPYVLQQIWSCDTQARLEAFVAALQGVIDRHDILRTAVVWEDVREPVQVVWRRARLPVETVRLEAEAGDAAAQLRARFDNARDRLDVRTAPLMRVVMAEDAAHGRWLLSWRLHHLVGDHTTLAVVRREIWAHLAGRQETLPAPLPFRTFVAQARLGVSRDEHRAYFSALLGDVTEPTTPFGLADVLGTGTDVVAVREEVDPDLLQRLRGRARMLGVSTASVCHLAFARVLATASGRSDVVFGTVLFGRMQGGEGADWVPGLFMNTLPMRVRLDATGVEDGVRQVQAQLAELLRHEHASLALAQRCSGVRTPAPLFSAFLNYRHHQHVTGPPSTDLVGASEGIRFVSADDRTNYPFALSVDEGETRMLLTAEAAPPCDPARVCRYMHCALANLLEALERAPATPVRRLDVLPASERRDLLETWNATTTPYPHDRCAHELIETQAMERPDAIAVAAEDQVLSYGELNRRANRLSHHLRGLGVGSDERVALCLARGPELMVAVLAALKAGAAYVPLDPTGPMERLALMLADSRPRVVLTQGPCEPAVRAALQIATGPDRAIDVLDLDADASRWAACSAANPPRDSVGLQPEHLAYVIYTSGTTGVPKGVMVRHRGLVNQILAVQRHYRITPGDRVLQFASITFDSSVEEVFGALASGATLVLRSDAWLTSAHDFLALCTRHALSFVNLPTRFWERLSQDPRAAMPDSLTRVAIGGEGPSPEGMAAWFAQAGRPALINAYGPTEATVNATMHEPAREDGGRMLIGGPIANLQAYVLDAGLEPAPIGVIGEVYVGGVGLARGYWRRAALTAAHFVADPYGAPGARLYRTGDLARYQPDGVIEFLGRGDFQVKVRGFRIELGEIEARVRGCPGVREAVVVARAHGGDTRLVAYYTRTAAAPAVDADDLRRHVLAALPDYMTPAAYVALDTLPLTPSGKVDRAALPAPEGDAYRLRRYEAPVGEIERRVAGIWAELLGVARVGRHDHFFDLGGHSLLALSASERMRQAGVAVDVRALFAAPTIAALTTTSGVAASAGSARSVTPIRPEGTERPLFLVHEIVGTDLWFSRLAPEIDASIPIYGLSGIPSDETPLHTMEALARRLADIMQTIQPVGPYRLAGWSFGGVLAYEIAVQLTGRDQVVEFLGLLDTHHPGPGPGATSDPSHHASPQQFLLSEIAKGDLSADQAAALDALTPSCDLVPLDDLIRRCDERGLLPAVFARYHLDHFRPFLPRMVAHAYAEAVYAIQPISIPVHLFVAREPFDESGAVVAADSALGWRATLSRGQLHITEVAGNHDSMMRPPCIADLGRAVSAALAAAASRAVAAPELDYRPHVVIQQAAVDDEPPIFCLPGGGASVTDFLALGHALGGRWTLHGLQPRGLDGVAVPHATVEAAASAYLTAIEQVAPHGPVHLIGHSFGGLVALEIAHRLRIANRRVASLTVIDSDPPDGDARYKEFTETQALVTFVAVMELAAERSLGIDVAACGLDPAQRLKVLHEAMVRATLMSGRARTSPEVLRGPLRMFSTVLRTTYRPRTVYPDPLRLVSAGDPRLTDADDRRARDAMAEGWRRWAPALTVWDAPGNHVTTLRVPHVDGLAGWWRRGAHTIDHELSVTTTGKNR
jgi:arthrofactin-type cyclic lipopeptide synthetase C